MSKEKIEELSIEEGFEKIEESVLKKLMELVGEDNLEIK